MRDGDELLFSTLVQLDNPVARAVWRRIEVQHRLVVRWLLAAAERRGCATRDETATIVGSV